MATWADVHRIASALPEATGQPMHGNPAWKVRDKGFAWERPLRKTDLAALGDAAPAGPILGVRVPGPEAKEARLAEHPEACFTIPHFDGYPAILVRLDVIDPDDLADLLVDAWLSRAPKRLAAAYLAAQQPG